MLQRPSKATEKERAPHDGTSLPMAAPRPTVSFMFRAMSVTTGMRVGGNPPAQQDVSAVNGGVAADDRRGTDCSSFILQRDVGIDVHGSAGWGEAGRETNGGQENSDCRQHSGFGTCYPVEQAREQL